jgi:RNA polymerase sigma factor (sigma-70 family)
MPIPAHLSRLAGPALRMQPDSRLVELVREGHERAFEEIVRRYRGPLTGFASGIIPPDRAEDVVQESLTKALQTIHADDRDLALKAWLYTIVRNRSLNALRDEPVHEEISLQHDGVPQPPDIAARRAEVASLVVGLKGLPEQQREAIVQRELSGLGHEQIAGNLGVSAGAVRQLIFRARTNLREGFGALIPLPVLRQILEAAAVRSAGADAAIVGGGGAVAVKLGIALLATGAAVGGGAALEHRSHDPIPGPVAEAAAAQRPGHERGVGGHGADGAPISPAVQPDSRSATDGHASQHDEKGGGDHSQAQGEQPATSAPSSSPGASSGEGSGNSGGDDSSGENEHSGSSGSGDEGDSGSSGHGPSGDDNSGPSHSGGDDGTPSGGDDSSGHDSSGGDDTSSGDDDPVVSEDPVEPSSGPGPSGDDGENSGSSEGHDDGA